MNRIFRSVVLVLLLVVFCFLDPTLAQEQTLPSKSGTKFFPLDVGNYWLYQGVRRWSRTGSKKVVEEPISWKMEVTEVIARDFITASVIKGHPQDVAWHKDGTQRGDYLILAIGDDRYYFIQGMRVTEVVARLKDKHDFLANLVYDDELFIRAPNERQENDVSPRQQEGPEPSSAWVVADEQKVDDRDTNGLSDPKFQKKFRLDFKALPNHTSVDFVPGVGITHYRYYHQGLVAEADLKLIEYFAG